MCVRKRERERQRLREECKCSLQLNSTQLQHFKSLHKSQVGIASLFSLSLSIYISLSAAAAAAANHVAVNLSTMFHTLSRSRGKQDVCTGRGSCSGRGAEQAAAKKINQLLSKIELAVEHTQVVLAQRHGDRQSAACMLLKYVSVRQRAGQRQREGAGCSQGMRTCILPF